MRVGNEDQGKDRWMLDILKLRISPDEFDQLRLCQIRPCSGFHAAFTVKSMDLTLPVASWGHMRVEERINVRGWIPLLDQIADEFLIFRPQGGCFFVSREVVTYRLEEHDSPDVIFLQLEMNRPVVVPPRQADVQRGQPVP